MKLTLLLGVMVALSPDYCGESEDPVLSLHGLLPDSTVTCEPALIGSWASLKLDSSRVFVIIPEDSGCVKAGLRLVVTDTARAAILLDSARMALLEPDSAARIRLKKDKKLRKRHVHDSTLVNFFFWSEVPKLTLKTIRDSTGLYVDFVGDQAETCWPNYCIEAHWIERADVWDDSLRFVAFTNRWLTASLDSGRLTTPAERQGSKYVLLGQSSDLQTLLQTAEKDSTAFPILNEPAMVRWPRKGKLR